jgi:hypothetical protein
MIPSNQRTAERLRTYAEFLYNKKFKFIRYEHWGALLNEESVQNELKEFAYTFKEYDITRQCRNLMLDLMHRNANHWGYLINFIEEKEKEDEENS